MNQVIMISLTQVGRRKRRRRKRSLGVEYDRYYLDAIWAGRDAMIAITLLITRLVTPQDRKIMAPANDDELDH